MKRLTIALLIGALCLGVTGVSAQSGDDACMQKGGTLTNGKCMLTIDARVSVDYPLDLASNDIVANTIDPFIQKTKDDFIQSLEGAFSPAPGTYELDMTYDTVSHSDKVASLVFTTYEFTGGAHGNTTFQTYTFDFQNSRLLTLNDLFRNTSDALAVIDPIVESNLTQTLGDMLDKDWLRQGTGVDPNNYQNFALDTNAITFYFPPYQVAPYAAGPQKVTIPFSQLNSVLAPEFAS